MPNHFYFDKLKKPYNTDIFFSTLEDAFKRVLTEHFSVIAPAYQRIYSEMIKQLGLLKQQLESLSNKNQLELLFQMKKAQVLQQKSAAPKSFKSFYVLFLAKPSLFQEIDLSISDPQSLIYKTKIKHALSQMINYYHYWQEDFHLSWWFDHFDINFKTSMYEIHDILDRNILLYHNTVFTPNVLPSRTIARKIGRFTIEEEIRCAEEDIAMEETHRNGLRFI